MRQLGQGGLQRLRVDKPDGVSLTVDKSDGDMIGELCLEGGIRIDVDKIDAHASLVADAGGNLNSVHAQVTARARQNDDASVG